jgi:hypothetical protein
MASTRFNSDSARVNKQLQESSGLIRYQLNAPGPGVDTPFFEDPHIRVQKWAANLGNNTTDLESDLRGINRKLGRGNVEYSSKTPASYTQSYGTQAAFVDETRASLPAWTLRDLENPRWNANTSFHDVQSKTEIPFPTKESTRIQQKSK